MEKLNKFVFALLLSSFALVGCNSLLDVDSDREVFKDEYDLLSANDTLYSVFGILSQLQKISDSYVLLGELRGDLMDVTDQSSMYLKEINNFEISSSNPYANNIKDYYSVINNCNYVINRIDTSVVKNADKVMLKVYGVYKGIRAWIYMQLALNYGSVRYYDKPILNVDDANDAIYPEYTFEQLAPVLIEDLKPLKDLDFPALAPTYYTTSLSFFPIHFLLGDLYLWTGEYEKAATEYYDLMYKMGYIITNPIITETTNKYVGKRRYDYRFTGDGAKAVFLPLNESETTLAPMYGITGIFSTNEYGRKMQLDSMVQTRKVIPSAVSIQNWDRQRYYYSYWLDSIGADLRKVYSVSTMKYDWTTNVKENTNNYLFKYARLNDKTETEHTSKSVFVYRVSLLYLRYAEAVNRLEKPNLAMAVLKNGLNGSTMTSKTIIPSSEKPNPLPKYMNFSDNRFKDNIGIRMCTLGKANLDSTFVIPDFRSSTTSKQDSILYMEDLIQQELALENAFEGNRFHDLMRLAIRRGDNDYLANIVSKKHNSDVIRGKLRIRDNWYIKLK